MTKKLSTKVSQSMQEKRLGNDRRQTERRHQLGLYEADRQKGNLYAVNRRISQRRIGERRVTL